MASVNASTVLDLDDGYRALTTGVACAPLAREAVWAVGPDAVSFLQGQLSADVAALAVGGSAWSFLLQPQGKVDAWLRATRLADDQVLLDVDAGFAEAVLARLSRFKLRVDADLSIVEGVTAAAVRGTGAAGAGLPDGVGPDRRLHAPSVWPGAPGLDVVACGPFDLADLRTVDGAPVPVAPPEALEAVRIEAGVPRLGAELTDASIPAEAGQWVVDASASFTKGCYTGQELVARVDSRGGNVPRPVRGVLVQGAGPGAGPAVGTEVRVGGEVVGELTSVGWSPARSAVVALAPLKRSVEPGQEVDVADSGPASVVALPFPPA